MIRQIEAYKKTGSLFDDPFSDDVSSEEENEKKDLAFDIRELYKQIGAPNPLQEAAPPSNPDAISSYKSNSSDWKLSLAMRGPKVFTGKDNISSIENQKALKQSPKKEAKSRRDEINSEPNPDQITLFSLYPDKDTRLVYKKYPNQGNVPFEDRSFAGYFIDIVKLLKGQLPDKVSEDKIMNMPKNNDETLKFDSAFESGNLYSAYKISDNEYDLILQNDINTKGHTQWFFFSVANTKKEHTVKFNIVNLLKPDSLFNQGMQPVIFSKLSNSNDKKGWFRDGFNISYFRNTMAREGVKSKRSYYTLTFTYTFPYSEDVVYFAHCFPYTYSRLTQYLEAIGRDPLRKQCITKKTLCQTLSQKNCEYLTITSKKQALDQDNRPVIFLTARQHPGESLASYMMEGILDFLTSQEEEAQIMRKQYVFKIIPMMNPDGVIHGNYRASLCGKDLNRIWRAPKKILQPTVYYAKQYILNLVKTRPVLFFCDFHGHSRKKNAFFYGNSVENDPFPARIFPFLLSKMSKYVSFEDSRFTVNKSKESTARIALWKELGIENVFTLEASFYGYVHEGKTYNFSEEDYINVGRDFCKGLYLYLTQARAEGTLAMKGLSNRQDSLPKLNTNNNNRSFKRKNSEDTITVSSLPTKMNETVPTKLYDGFRSQDIIRELMNNKNLIDVGFRMDDSGSDSDPSADELSSEDMKKIFPTKVQTSFKKYKQKIKTDREKTNPITEVIYKKSEKQVTEVKTEATHTLAKIKDKIERSTSAQTIPFRIKNHKKKEIQNYKSAQQPGEEAKGVDKATQTDDNMFITNEEQNLDINQASNTQKSFRTQMSNSFNKNIVAVKTINSLGSDLGSLMLFDDKSFLMKPSPIKGGMYLKGIKVEESKGEETKVDTGRKGSALPVHLKKHQISRGTSVDAESQTSRSRPRVNKILRSWMKNENPLQDVGKVSNKGVEHMTRNSLFLKEKKNSVESFTQEKEYYLEQEISRRNSDEPASDSTCELPAEVQKSQFLKNKYQTDVHQQIGRRLKRSEELPKKVLKNENIIKPPADFFRKNKGISLRDLHKQDDRGSGRSSSPNSRLIKKAAYDFSEERSLYSGSPQLSNKGANESQRAEVGKSNENIAFYPLATFHSKGLLSSNRSVSVLNDKSLIKTAVKIAKEIKESWKFGTKKRNNLSKFNTADQKYEENAGSANLTPKKSITYQSLKRYESTSAFSK